MFHVRTRLLARAKVSRFDTFLGSMLRHQRAKCLHSFNIESQIEARPLYCSSCFGRTLVGGSESLRMNRKQQFRTAHGRRRDAAAVQRGIPIERRERVHALSKHLQPCLANFLLQAPSSTALRIRRVQRSALISNSCHVESQSARSFSTRTAGGQT